MVQNRSRICRWAAMVSILKGSGDLTLDAILANLQIDAFTDHAFGGNSAAVCYLPYEKNDKWLQLIAREFNLSETAFLVKRQNTTTRSKDAQKGRLLEVDDESGKTLKDVQQQKKGIAVEEENEFDLRWFTPTVEVC
jgi:hypothetical protein